MEKKLPKAALYLIALIIVVGAIVGVSSVAGSLNSAKQASAGPNANFANVGSAVPSQANAANQVINYGGTTVAEQTATASATMMEVITSESTITQAGTTGIAPQNSQNGATQSTSASSSSLTSPGYLEFFSNVTLQVVSPPSTMQKVSAVAYSLGGYVAYSFAENSSALAVIRIPAANYQNALAQVEGLGNVTFTSSTSNDVSVQYTDLNATLQSLLTEQASLLQIMNKSTLINNTLTIESQIQGVDAQINSIESQLLETRTLIDYSTISVSISTAPLSAPPPQPLSMKVTATPTSGKSPLAVTFNALVTGGDAPYIINYNFGDGTSSQAQALIHTFTNAGTYNVTITATDSLGNATSKFVIITISSPPATAKFSAFSSTIAALFFGVLEGIAEVAAVVLPLAAVAALVIVPIRNRTKIFGGRKAEGQTGKES